MAKVTGDLYEKIDGKLFEIKRQVRQPGGYPFDAEELDRFLQLATEGRFNSTEPKYHEENGVISFEVVSEGKTGEQWDAHFKEKGVKIGDYARQGLLSKDFKPTSGVKYSVKVLKGELFSDDDRITEKIRKEAKRHKLKTPPMELACLIRDKFSDKELEKMGLYWIVAMHEPFKDSDGDPSLLGTDRHGGKPWLNAFLGWSGGGWAREYGFAFLVSQVSSQN